MKRSVEKAEKIARVKLNTIFQLTLGQMWQLCEQIHLISNSIWRQ